MLVKPSILRCSSFLLILFCFSAKADSLNNLLFHQEHRTRLDYHLKKADQHVANNLNRYGLEQLRDYNDLLDTLFHQELEDTVLALENNFLKTAAENINALENTRRDISEMTGKRDDSKHIYNTLLRKAILAFACWLLIVLILLKFRKRKLKKQETLLNDSILRHDTLDRRSMTGKSLKSRFSELVPVMNEFTSTASEIGKSVQNAYEQLPAGHSSMEEIKKLSKSAEQLSLNARKERLLCIILNDFGTFSEDIEPQSVNVNEHCDAILELCRRSFANEEQEFSPQCQTDLEKNLPTLKIIPAALDALLLNITLNAFQSVYTKFQSGEKNYVPKVNISTRILPRFLQIRIKDNGEGIPDNMLEKIREEFETTRPAELAAGLGLTDSINILQGFNKAELKIESEAGASTDVYLKFYL